ncbi:hypothetical protein AB0M47_06045 [Hamadaea sp. NPDC051192]|uniref:hypothetical protein n=1 Tax=Hamadaea sp. NPDC051192 TaxID=3154940 RepID=UPI0034137364
MVRTVIRDLLPRLPDIETLRQRCLALATLEAVASPEWQSRYYSFDPRWADGEQMASMRNGSGDEYSIVFTGAGVFLRGFAHESNMSPAANDEELWPGLLDGLPGVFQAQASEPAFSYEGHLEATFCAWREHADVQWRTGEVVDDPAVLLRDGSEMVEILCDGTGQAYQKFAEDYYERRFDLATIAQIYAGRPLTETMVASLNTDTTLAEIADEVTAMGYPVA